MSEQVKPIPEGFHTVTPHLVVSPAAEAIDFYKKAFGAEELGRALAPDGSAIFHASLKIGDSMLFLCDQFQGAHSPKSLGGTPVTLHVYVENVDTVFDQAVAAGASVVMPVQDMFWGDRYGMLTDPFGHSWSVATHIKEVSKEESAKAAEEAFASMDCGGQSQAAAE
jgi:PhnB protein